MDLFPNDSNGDSPLPEKPHRNSGLSPAREKAAKQQARKWFAILLTIGLVLGSVMAVGVVKLINKFGLNQKPERPFLERPK